MREGEKGRLVAPFDNVDGYVACLADACQQPKQLMDLRDAAQKPMEERRTFARFAQILGPVPGYVEPVG